jgi:hypothetical protein
MLQACVAGGQIDIEGFWGLTSCGDVTLLCEFMDKIFEGFQGEEEIHLREHSSADCN